MPPGTEAGIQDRSKHFPNVRVSRLCLPAGGDPGSYLHHRFALDPRPPSTAFGLASLARSSIPLARVHSDGSGRRQHSVVSISVAPVAKLGLPMCVRNSSVQDVLQCVESNCGWHVTSATVLPPVLPHLLCAAPVISFFVIRAAVPPSVNSCCPESSASCERGRDPYTDRSEHPVRQSTAARSPIDAGGGTLTGATTDAGSGPRWRCTTSRAQNPPAP
jgi:hypothetical protein